MMNGRATRFTDVHVFDGTGNATFGPTNVVVADGHIAGIGADAALAADGRDLVSIDGTGCTLMPGLIDAHWHAMMAAVPMQVAMAAGLDFLAILAADQARATLHRGFTSVRDMGGPSFGLKRAIDEGLTPGPRIWPSGAFISQTAGHGDFRLPYEVPRAAGEPLSHIERVGVGVIADSPDEVRLRAREQLRMGASQLKLMAGGGVASMYDPLDVTQYTRAEIAAAVEAAENWGTYVTVHVYTPRGMRMAIEAGVRSIEHGQLADEATAELMAERGIWWSLQPFLDDEDANPQVDPASRAKQLVMTAGTDAAYALAKKHGIRTAWGTDTLFDAGLAAKQGKQLAKMARWYSPAEVLRMVTADNAELLALSGARSPYPGRLGVVADGAIADLLLVAGDPLADLSIMADPVNLKVVMKGGVIVSGR
jgi:imidazolonepropionase-like amidohydrolase